MLNRSMKCLFRSIGYTKRLSTKEASYQKFVYNFINQYQSLWSEAGNAEFDKQREGKEVSNAPSRHIEENKGDPNSHISKYNSDDEYSGDSKWKLELDWLSKALEPALQLYKWALPTGDGIEEKSPPSTRSVSEIIASIQRSKVGVQDWSLSDITLGLYLIYLRQASSSLSEDIKGDQISCESTVQDLIYHTELAKGAYKSSAASLARNSMIRESNVLKFIKDSSVMRPGYYIALDHRRKLVVFGIRGTHTVFDLITNIVTSSNEEELTFEGYSSHFGTTEAARWFLRHEMGNIRKCLKKHEGYRLRLVGHSLGGATASLFAIMLHKMTPKELGFSPSIVSAVGYATPPCVSRELAEGCSDYVTTVVMQGDIIPRLSIASLTRLRNEIIQTDWTSILEKEDWKLDLVANAKQVVCSVQDAARKLAQYAKLKTNTDNTDVSKNSPAAVPKLPSSSRVSGKADAIVKKNSDSPTVGDELFIPGSVYYLKRNPNTISRDINDRNRPDFFTLWKRQPGEHFQRIILPNVLISDHKCDSHYYALRDVLKGLPGSVSEDIF